MNIILKENAHANIVKYTSRLQTLIQFIDLFVYFV